MEISEYYRFLKFCPECAGKLEQSPISSDYACFLHGDFEIRDGRIIWLYTENLITRGDLYGPQ